MATAIEQLLVLQERDQQIRRLRQEMKDIPLRQQQIEARLQAHQAGLDEAEKVGMEHQAKIKALEMDVETGKQAIRKYREQQTQLKSNEEYKAFEKQIATQMTQIRSLEDQTLDMMEEAETLKEGITARREALEKEKGRVQEELQTFAERTGGLGEELQKLEEERKTLAADIDPSWLSRYERLFDKKGDAAISLVDHGTCSCCHMKLTPAQVLDARKTDTLTLCHFCGRMLYLAH